MQCGADVSDPSRATTGNLDDAGAARLVSLLKQETKGEFEIARELGRGGMAAVYLATEVGLKRKVAIKVLPPELTFGQGAIERFQQEAQTAAGLDHPNIIPIYRISSSGRLFWYAMKCVEGESLEDLLAREKRLSLEGALMILGQIADALDFAHKHHVIHRDIKPANIMLEKSGRTIVTDFGIAKALTATSLTASGAAIGTPYYMSPEQCAGWEISGASDQYSVGVMTYQMLSGQLPFEAESAVELLHKHCFVPPPPLDVLCPKLPANVCRAVIRAFAKRPSERFLSVSAFAEELERHKGGSPAVTSRRDSARWARQSTVAVGREPRRRRLAWVLGLVALVASFTGVWWWLNYGTGSQRLNSAVAPPPTEGAAMTQEVQDPTVAGADARSTPGVPAATKDRPVGTAYLTVGTRPLATIFVNGGRTPTNPLVNFEVPAGTVWLRFEVTDSSGTWSDELTFTLAGGERRNLGRIKLR